MRSFVCLVLLFSLALCFAASADAGEKAKPIKLFNGKNMDGWTFHLRDEKAKMQDVWSVNDGVIICGGNPAGYIRTKESYKNYVLELEWRFNPEKGAGNSGVLLRQTGKDKVWPKSFEAQLMSQNAGDIWLIDNFHAHTAKDRTKGRNTKKAHKSNEKPLGEWNKYRIVCDGGKIQLFVNGLLQNEASECAEDAGPICLQSEGAEIHFRNIVLTPLKE